METQTASDISGVVPEIGPPSPAAPKRRGRIVWIAVLAVVVLVAGGLSWFLAYGATYQPLTPGDGYENPSGAGKVITDGLSDTAFIVVGPTGAKGLFTLTLANNGSRPVRVLGLPPNMNAMSVAWAASPSDSIPSGEKSHPFPVTIPAGQQILLLLTVTQPRCPQDGGEYGDVPLRWEALGWHHLYDLPLDGELNKGFMPIAVCPPASAIRHIDKNA